MQFIAQELILSEPVITWSTMQSPGQQQAVDVIQGGEGPGARWPPTKSGK